MPQRAFTFAHPPALSHSPSRAAVTLQAAPNIASCTPAQFLAPLRPTIAIQSSGAAGMMLRAVNGSTDAIGAVTWSQELSSLPGLGAGAAALPARAYAGGVLLGDPADIPVRA